MNDELTGQLTSNTWRIPQYLQNHLWIVTLSDTVRAEGDTGLFELSVPARTLAVHLAGEAGPALALLSWEPDALGWDGQVQLGGMVESVTVQQAQGVPVSVVGLVGQPLIGQAAPYAGAAHRADADYTPPTFDDGLADTAEGFYTLLLPEDSPLAALLETALLNRVRVWVSGRIPADAEGWHPIVALPLILERVTLFAGL